MSKKENVGRVDQIIRYFLGSVFLLLGLVISPFFLIGTVVMFLTAYFKFCGLYRIFGIGTCKIEEAKKKE
jgi:hypothetical protein